MPSIRVLQHVLFSLVIVGIAAPCCEAQTDPPPDKTDPKAAVGGIGGGGNFGKIGRLGPIGANGVSTMRITDDALTWLKNHQRPDGSWSSAHFDLECGKQDDDVICSGKGSPQQDVGVTGLALLAFLGTGNTHRVGKYKYTCMGALTWLVDIQDPDGNFADSKSSDLAYGHIIATVAMCEAYAITRDDDFELPSRKAVEFMSVVLEDKDDITLIGWAVVAMTVAREYDIAIDQSSLDRCMRILVERTDESGRTVASGLGARDQTGGEPGAEHADRHERPTALALLARIFADPTLSTYPGNREMIDKGVELIEARPIAWDTSDPGEIDFHYWYYGSYALYQYSVIDSKPWKAWEKGMREVLSEHQAKEGEAKGSWDPSVDPWGNVGGRVYSTAMLALCMEVYYRYDTVLDR